MQISSTDRRRTQCKLHACDKDLAFYKQKLEGLVKIKKTLKLRDGGAKLDVLERDCLEHLQVCLFFKILYAVGILLFA